MPNFQLIDLHQDLLPHIQDREIFNNFWQTNFDLLKQANVKIVVATAFPNPPDGDYFNPANNLITENQINDYLTEIKSRDWTLVKTKADFEQVLSTPGQRGLILHIEGFNTFADTPEYWKLAQRWYDLGWRSLALVWNQTNRLGGGTLDSQQGLTELGEKIIKWALERNMILDLAHANSPTFWQAAKIINKPILISHAAADALCPNPRNLDDEKLKAVAESGGVIGVFFSKKFISGAEAATLDHVVSHIDYIKKLVGIDHVALGSDFGGIISGTPQKLSSIADIDNLWQSLAEQGYTTEMIKKISYKNSQRVLGQYLN